MHAGVVPHGPEQGAAEAAPPRPRVAAGLAVGFGAPVVVALLLHIARLALDGSQPDTGRAAVWLGSAVLLALGVACTPWVILPGHPKRLGIAAAALPVTSYVAWIATSAYGTGAGLLMLFFIFAVGPLWLLAWCVLGIVAAVQARSAGGVRIMPEVLALGVGMALGIGLRALAILLNIDQHAEQAREAHEAPLPAMVWTFAVLLVIAVIRRRKTLPDVTPGRA